MRLRESHLARHSQPETSRQIPKETKSVRRCTPSVVQRCTAGQLSVPAPVPNGVQQVYGGSLHGRSVRQGVRREYSLYGRSVQQVYGRCTATVCTAGVRLVYGRVSLYGRCTAGVQQVWVCTAGVRQVYSRVYSRWAERSRQRLRWLTINTPWLRRRVSGWLVTAVVGSRKRITNNYAVTRPLRHRLRCCQGWGQPWQPCLLVSAVHLLYTPVPTVLRTLLYILYRKVPGYRTATPNILRIYIYCAVRRLYRPVRPNGLIYTLVYIYTRVASVRAVG